jgi:hypothetical protein
LFANATTEQIARIEEILRLLDQQRTDASANRRRADRINIHASLTAMVLADNGTDASLQIYSRNISTSGIGFVSRRMCKKGERLALSFDLPGRPHKLVLAKVTFCRYVRAGLYDAGAEFLECITGEVGRKGIPGHWMPSVPLPVQMIEETDGPRRSARLAR